MVNLIRATSFFSKFSFAVVASAFLTFILILNILFSMPSRGIQSRCFPIAIVDHALSSMRVFVLSHVLLNLIFIRLIVPISILKRHIMTFQVLQMILLFIIGIGLYFPKLSMVRIAANFAVRVKSRRIGFQLMEVRLCERIFIAALSAASLEYNGHMVRLLQVTYRHALGVLKHSPGYYVLLNLLYHKAAYKASLGGIYAVR